MGNGRVTAPRAVTNKDSLDAALKGLPENGKPGTEWRVPPLSGALGEPKSVQSVAEVLAAEELDSSPKPSGTHGYGRHPVELPDLARAVDDHASAASMEAAVLRAVSPERAAEVDAWRRSLAFRRQLRSDAGKRKLQRFIDVAQRDARTGMGVPPGVIEKTPRWLRDAFDGEIFILDNHMADVAAKRAVASTRATINPFEPFAPEGVVWFPNLMSEVSPFVERATNGLLGKAGPTDKDATDEMMDRLDNHLEWMIAEHPFLGGDALAGIAWKVDGKKVTIFWLSYDFYTAFTRAQSWVDCEHFYSETQAGPYDFDNVMKVFGINPALDMSLFHYWSCDSASSRHDGCDRPDQPDAPFVTPFDATVWENKDQKSKLVTFAVDEEMCQEMDNQMWFQISFACEVLRLMGQEITRHVPVNRHTGGRDLERDIKRHLPQRGIHTFVLRRFKSDDGEGSGFKRPRGPLTTRHPRRACWAVLPSAHGDDDDCRHQWKGSSVSSVRRRCEHCGRVERWRQPPIKGYVGPDDAPWAYAIKIGLVTR